MELTLKWTRAGLFLGGWKSKAKDYHPRSILPDGTLVHEIPGVMTETDPDGFIYVTIEVDHSDDKEKIRGLELAGADLAANHKKSLLTIDNLQHDNAELQEDLQLAEAMIDKVSTIIADHSIPEDAVEKIREALSA